MTGRSRAPHGSALLLCLLALLGFTTYVINSHLGWVRFDTLLQTVFYGLLSGMVLIFIIGGSKWKSYAHLPVAPGRVLAIVPAYNEEPHLLRATIVALAAQTRPPDAIYVMDDGSKVPVVPFDHPGVIWLSQPNQGKRHAQANVLMRFEANEWDYIFTVDSDSVVDADALEHMLRAMSDPEVQACTGMLLVRNWSDNLLTRLVDINVVSSCLLGRMARSAFGAVCPTSGAIALYRAEIIYDNLEDYLNSGTVGDDRRLSLYALMRGKVVGVSEAVVETALPDSYKGTFKQRSRWSQSAWLAAPFVVTNIRWIPMFFYMYPLVFAAIWPLAALAVVDLAFRGYPMLVLYAVTYWMVVALAEGIVYAVYRPNFTLADRMIMWATSVLSPLFGLLLLRPAMYWALTKLSGGRAKEWGTREVMPEPLAVPAATEHQLALTGAGVDA